MAAVVSVVMVDSLMVHERLKGMALTHVVRAGVALACRYFLDRVLAICTQVGHFMD